MGCTSSTLTDWLRPGGKMYSKNAEKKTILVLKTTLSSRSYLSRRAARKGCSRSWTPERIQAFPLTLQILNQTEMDFVQAKAEEDNLAEEAELRVNLEDRWPAQGQSPEVPLISSKSILETPPRVCPEQERRLRCANLEVLPGRGGIDSDDDEDGFQFAKVEESSTSCITDSMFTDISMLQEADKSNCVDGGLAYEESQENLSIFSESMVEELSKVCAEQERRLRCANLELMPGRGVDSDDEEDGFQFAKIEESPTSCITDVGTPPTHTSDKCDVVNHSGLLESSVDDFSTVQLSPASNAPVEVHPFSYFHARNYFISTSPFFSSNSEHSASSDLSPGLALQSPADVYEGRQPLGLSPECHAGSHFSASESVPDSFSESGIDEAPSSTPMSEWSFQSPDMRWDLSSSLQEREHSDSLLVHTQSNCPYRSAPAFFNAYHKDALIPGLPDDLARVCLMHVPFVKYNPKLRMVCKSWKTVLSSEEFFSTRKALGIHETHISFVVHGNRVQIFNLQTCKWLCLPPLPKEEGNISPEWGIDPYEWWQIDTVAVTNGTLFVIGGDKAAINSIAYPSKRTNRVHRYDYCQNCWVPVTSMLVARSHAAAMTFGDCIFVAGGSEDKETGASAEVYDYHENSWSFIANMNSSMRMCVGMEHDGKFYVKGENTGAGGLVEGEIYDVSSNTWNSMSPGMRRGLARGPIAFANSTLFVADWKDSQLKRYVSEQDSWEIVTRLPARISRLVGYKENLFGLTGKIKVNPYNHHVISDSPAEVWLLELGKGDCLDSQEKEQRVCSTGKRIGEWDNGLRGIMESALDQQDRAIAAERHTDSEIGDDDSGYVWECLWRDPMQIAKTGGLAWVPCIAHCTLFDD